MYRVIHVHCEEELEARLNELAEEGYYLDSFEAYEGAEDFHYIAILALLEDEDEE